MEGLEGLTTAHLTEACLERGIDPRLAPQEIVPMVPDVHVTGRVLPERHSGSVDIFIEAISQAQPGSVLVIDETAAATKPVSAISGRRSLATQIPL